MPPKIRQLIRELEAAGFENCEGKGSHRKFVHPNVPRPVVLSGNAGHDALSYQQNAVKRAIAEAKK